MKILYVGDVMGEPGLRLVEAVLPAMRTEYAIELVVAQAENVSHGKGVLPEDFRRLRQAGVDFCTGGNWSLQEKAIIPFLNDPVQPIIRPANYPAGTPGLGWKYVTTPAGQVLIISLLGHVVGRDADKPVDNPLRVIDEILALQEHIPKVATVVNFHGDYSSEKVIIGQYLDGRVTAVIGDHWHVPTADARVLAKGTAHQSDVGMVGILDASLGIKLTSVIPRWRDEVLSRNELEMSGPRQFNAVLISIDHETCLATAVKSLNLTYPAAP